MIRYEMKEIHTAWSSAEFMGAPFLQNDLVRIGTYVVHRERSAGMIRERPPKDSSRLHDIITQLVIHSMLLLLYI